MQVMVELLVFSAGGILALATTRLLLGGVLGLTFGAPPQDGGRARTAPAGPSIRTPVSSSAESNE